MSSTLRDEVSSQSWKGEEAIRTEDDMVPLHEDLAPRTFLGSLIN